MSDIPQTPGSYRDYALYGVDDRTKWFGTVHIGQIKAYDPVSGHVDVKMNDGRLYSSLMFIPGLSASYNFRPNVSWLRYAPQIGDWVRCCWTSSGTLEVLGFYSFGRTPNRVNNNGGYQPLIESQEPGHAEFGALLPGEIDMRSSGGAYLYLNALGGVDLTARGVASLNLRPSTAQGIVSMTGGRIEHRLTDRSNRVGIVNLGVGDDENPLMLEESFGRGIPPVNGITPRVSYISSYRREVDPDGNEAITQQGTHARHARGGQTLSSDENAQTTPAVRADGMDEIIGDVRSILQEMQLMLATATVTVSPTSPSGFAVGDASGVPLATSPGMTQLANRIVQLESRIQATPHHSRNVNIE